MPPTLRALIEGLALKKPPLTAASVHRQVEKVAAAKGWRKPSYRTVAALIQRLDPSLVMLAHEGTRAYRETYELLFRRESAAPNEMWQADHTPLDLWIRDDHGQPARPWLTVILDDYSRAVAGWRLSLKAPSAFQTALTLRQAIWRKSDPRWHVCGIPEIFYTDHGSDFTSRHMEQVAADLKIRLIFSNVGEPRGRGKIERFFRTLDQLFLCEQPGFAPSGTPRPEPKFSLKELETKLEAFLLDEYHHRVNDETGSAPQERWENRGFLPQMAESLEQLDLLLLTLARSRHVRRDGIHFQSLRYIEPTLAAYIGETVTIRYDPRDLSEIRVFHQERFLCRAICQELAGREVGLEEIVQARQARRRQLRAQLSERSQVVDLLLSVHQAPPPEIPDPAPAVRPGPRLRRYLDDNDTDR